MEIVVEALVFGVAVAFMLVGLMGIVVPILPGTILIWLGVLAYALVNGFQAIDWLTFTVLTLIALITGTADIWLTLLGAKTGGASFWALVYGLIGGIVGFFLFGSLLPIVGNLFGGIIGYALGILIGQYQKHRDWNLALKASFGGIVGWGIATIVQFGGGLMMIAIFIWQVLSY